MAEVNETCEFEVGADHIELTTRTNGDSIKINNLSLTQEQATSLAWLVNDQTHDIMIKIEMKQKT